MLATVLVGIGITAVVAVLMEGVAWLTHRYAMHGFLWVLHRDHHHPKGRGLQKNDLFAAFFATISFLLIAAGTFGDSMPPIAVGAGMALYGVGYFLFHDVMFHRRVPRLRLRASTPYLRRIVNAHRVHHRATERDGATSFGFLYAPSRYNPVA
ncbi:MAG: sterol desaturase family protein [Anaerolineae bacterium]